MDRLKIFLLTRYFPPEIGTAANLFFELARGLSKRGHRVTVVTNFPWYNLETIPRKYRGKYYMKEKFDGFDVIRIKSPDFGTKKIKLLMGHITVPFTTLLGGLFVRKPDSIFIYSPPLFMGITAWIISSIKKVPWIMGVQDLHPQCYIDQGVLKNKFLIYVLETIEKFCYKKASYITVHSEGNKRHIVEKKEISEKKVTVIYNWIDMEELKPLPRDNDFSRKYGLNGKFIVGYAGTLGMSQGLMSIVETANILRDRDDIEFFIVGDGIEKKKMIKRVKELNLTNVRFLKMQPKAVYPYVLASSDVQLVTLNKNVKTPVVPSKILSIMAAGRPVLASLPLDGDSPKIIKKAGCGICVGPEDPYALAKEIIKLAENPEMRRQFSQNGREFVVREMSLTKAISDLEALFEKAIKEYHIN